MKDDWQKSAERENARRVAQAPLLAHAGLVRLTSPAERQRQVEDQRAKWSSRRAEHDAHGAALAVERLAAVRAQVSPQDAARVDRHLAALPPSYAPMALSEMLDRLAQGLPALEASVAPTDEMIAEWRRAGSAFVAVLNAASDEELAIRAQIGALNQDIHDRAARRARRALLAQLVEVRDRRLRRLGYGVEVCAGSPEVAVRIAVGERVHALALTRAQAKQITVPQSCPGCAADPLPVGLGLASEGPSGLTAQAVCQHCNATIGRFEAWWIEETT